MCNGFLFIIAAILLLSHNDDDHYDTADRGCGRNADTGCGRNADTGCGCADNDGQRVNVIRSGNCCG